MLRVVRGIAVAKPGEVEVGQWSMRILGSASLAPTRLVHLVEAGVRVQRLGAVPWFAWTGRGRLGGMLSAMTLPPPIVGNIGLYYVCFKLSKLGWNVMPTSRNTRGIDVVCFSMDGKRKLTIQVKSLSKRPSVPLGKSLDKIMGDYWVIVNSLNTDKPRMYVLLPDEVRARAACDSKGAYWLETKKYAIDEFEENWQRIEHP